MSTSAGRSVTIRKAHQIFQSEHCSSISQPAGSQESRPAPERDREQYASIRYLESDAARLRAGRIRMTAAPARQDRLYPQNRNTLHSMG